MASVTNSLVSNPNLHSALPFPGKGAQFIVVEEKPWKLCDGAFPVRSLTLVSQTDDSFFQSVFIGGYRDGTISFHYQIRYVFPAPKPEVREYFKSRGINIDLPLLIADTVQQRTVLFGILSQHNTIPPEHLDLIRKLSAAENWLEVTPLAPDEHLSPDQPIRHSAQDEQLIAILKIQSMADMCGLSYREMLDHLPKSRKETENQKMSNLKEL